MVRNGTTLSSLGSPAALAFVEELAAVPDVDRLRSCIQCGACSGACPMTAYMDFTPRRLMELTREGYRDEVLRSTSIWVCTGCYACTEACPKQIPVTDIMYGLRRAAFREATYPKRFTTPVLAREMVNMTRRRGRGTESWLSLKLYLKTAPIQLLKYIPLGQRLLRSGRLGIRRESIRKRDELHQLLEAAA